MWGEGQSVSQLKDFYGWLEEAPFSFLPSICDLQIGRGDLELIQTMGCKGQYVKPLTGEEDALPSTQEEEDR